MRLHYSPGTIAVASAIALHEAGIAFEPVRVDFTRGEQTEPAYLAINPKGRVPALETEGTILTETGAILDYIAAVTPQADLVPDTPLEAAHMRAVMYYLASTMHVNHAHRMRGHRWADKADSHADMAAKVPQTMTDSARFVTTDCLRGDFVLGPRFSIADPYLFTVCNWLAGDGVDLTAFPEITAFQQRMEDRDSVKATREMGIMV